MKLTVSQLLVSCFISIQCTYTGGLELHSGCTVSIGTPNTFTFPLFLRIPIFKHIISRL